MGNHIKHAILNGALWQVMLVAVLAGAAVSLTSCTLARLPFMLGHVHVSKQTSRRSLYLALAFSTGLILSYTSIGLLLGVISSFARKLIFISEFIYIIFGVFLVLCGIFFAGLIPKMYEGFHQHCYSAMGRINTIPATFAFGIFFAFLEMPACAGCGVGMLLISSLVAIKGSVLYSALVFFSFALGQSLPIIAIGASSALVKRLAPQLEKFERKVSFVAGNILIIVGLFLVMIA